MSPNHHNECKGITMVDEIALRKFEFMGHVARLFDQSAFSGMRATCCITYSRRCYY